MPPPAPYPLLFTPTILEKVWGGRRLETLGKTLSGPAAKYGESWELADMPATSSSGAGGGAIRSVIANGPLAGQTLHDALGAWGDDLLPSPPPDGNFPLLIKFLDASENLSVQVHPSPAYAQAHPEAHLKTECWYILAAEPDAMIYKGIKPNVTREQFSALARAQDPKIIDTLIALPAIPGECHNLPSGTVHALGAGVLVAEVQIPSDTTFRLYDWGRGGPALRAGSASDTPTLPGGPDTPTLRGGPPPRELHIDQALACATFPGEPGHAELSLAQTLASIRPGGQQARLVTTDFFVVDELRPSRGEILPIGAGGPRPGAECIALIILDGAGSLVSEGQGYAAVSLRRADTLLIPTTIAPQSMLVAGSGLRALRVGIP